MKIIIANNGIMNVKIMSKENINNVMRK